MSIILSKKENSVNTTQYDRRVTRLFIYRYTQFFRQLIKNLYIFLTIQLNNKFVIANITKL